MEKSISATVLQARYSVESISACANLTVRHFYQRLLPLRPKAFNELLLPITVEMSWPHSDFGNSCPSRAATVPRNSLHLMFVGECLRRYLLSSCGPNDLDDSIRKSSRSLSAANICWICEWIFDFALLARKSPQSTSKVRLEGARQLWKQAPK